MSKLREELSWSVGVLVAIILCAPFLPVVALVCAVRRTVNGMYSED